MNKLSFCSAAMFAAVSFGTNANTINLDTWNSDDVHCSPACDGLVVSTSIDNSANFDWSLTDATGIEETWRLPLSSLFDRTVYYINIVLVNSGIEPVTGYKVRSTAIDTFESTSITTAAPFWSLSMDNSKTWFFSNNPNGMPTEITGIPCDGVGFRPCRQYITEYNYTPSPVPIPAAAWLFGSALVGLLGIARRKNNGGFFNE
jgi:hypothetical protein